tara:strand:- start:3864 stop:4196 length:333 start_codon:yes stop_codon:yes gene_type:complete
MRYNLFFFLILSNLSFGQLISGNLLDEGRKLLDKPAFIIEGIADGWIKIELAVDRTGKVTSARQVDSNLKSTPARFEAKKHVRTFKFQPGTYYPKFHHVIVKITVLKGRE